jgi:hypothetical protein
MVPPALKGGAQRLGVVLEHGVAVPFDAQPAAARRR